MDDLTLTQDNDIVARVTWQAPHNWNKFVECMGKGHLHKTGGYADLKPRETTTPEHGSTTSRGQAYRFMSRHVEAQLEEDGEVTSDYQTGDWHPTTARLFWVSMVKL